MKKKILVIDDSALMRRVLCDIINSDDRFEVVDTAFDGLQGFKCLVDNRYDAVVMDVYMPRMTGLQLLAELQKAHVPAKVMMASTTTGEGAKETIAALELGAIDFIKKPENVADARQAEFIENFLDTLNAVANASAPRPRSAANRDSYRRSTVTRDDSNVGTSVEALSKTERAKKPVTIRNTVSVKGSKLVAIASSTGGPRALQEVIPYLPSELNAPVLLVQHMPKNFTASLADRLNELSPITVSEVKNGEKIEKGHVYVAQGGLHLKVEKKRDGYYAVLSDEPPREGVKPCANYMYESLSESDFDQIVCVVLTGMGADGTEGIKNLDKKKQIHVIAQDEATCTVYGMPKAIANSGLVNEVVPLSQIAEQITKNVGVH